MKLAGWILTLYLTLLAVIPCCAFDDCPEDKTQTELPADHEKGDEDCGNCSPFFNCSGCASSSINVPTISFHLNSIVAPRSYTNFIHPYIPEVHYDFWQPPKLV